MYQKMLRKLLILTIQIRLNWTLSKKIFTESDNQTIFPTVLAYRILFESVDALEDNLQSTIFPILNIKKKIIEYTKPFTNYVARQKSNVGTWNYWIKESHKSTSNPYPDDLDDTCNIYYMFQKLSQISDDEVFGTKDIFNLTKALLDSERKQFVGIAYNTWIYTQKSTDIKSQDNLKNTQIMEDIDPVVQIIILKVLLKLKCAPDEFLDFIADKIYNLPSLFWASKYYHSKLYILAELTSIPLEIFDNSKNNTIDFENVSLLRESLIQSYTQIKESGSNSVNSSLYNQILRIQIEIQLGILDISTLKGILQIAKLILYPVSIYTKEPIYIESISKGVNEYHYSKMVIHSMYIRVLTLLLKYINRDTKNSFVLTYSNAKKISFKKIFDEIKRQISDRVLASYVSATSISPMSSLFDFDQFINKVFKGYNTLEIIHSELHDFALNIKKYKGGNTYNSQNIHDRYITENSHYTNDEFLTQPIYTLTLYGWISYTIYDKLVDKELDISFLSYANHCNQVMFSLVYSQLKYIQNSKYIEKTVFDILTELNRAQLNTREIHNIEGGKSIGHCIGPLLIFATIVPSWNTLHITHLIEYYRYHLSLKQISDDVHDWKDDMQIDKDTYVTRQIKSTVKPQASEQNDMEWYVHVFSSSVLYRVRNDMRIQTQKAIDSLLKIEKYFNKKYIQNRINETKKYLRGIEQAITEIEVYNLFKHDKSL